MVEARRYLLIVLSTIFLTNAALVNAAGAGDLRYWVEPCQRAETGCKAADSDLAQWAMEAWQQASGGKLKVARTTNKESGQIRFYWITTREGLFGETRGGDIYVRPEPGEGLLRDTVVYLTCLHESGHALGLRHTAEFADIMYNFQFGGDIAEYFGRYQRLLTKREDIRKISAISPNDKKQLSAATQ
jgi:hypothetical protein